MAVVLSWVSKPARSVPDNFAIASRAALPLSDWSFIRAMASYQIPTSALARLGLSFNVSVLMTSRSSISGDLAGVVYQRRTRVSLHLQELRIPGHHRGGIGRLRGRHDIRIRSVDGLDILFLQFHGRQAARQQIVRHRQFDEIELLALDVG